MNIGEMTKNLQELVDDPEKAAVIFSVILKSENTDIIQRALELYVLLILNHAEEISTLLNEEHDREQTYEQIIERLEHEIHDCREIRDQRKERAAEAGWKIFTDLDDKPF